MLKLGWLQTSFGPHAEADANFESDYLDITYGDSGNIDFHHAGDDDDKEGVEQSDPQVMRRRSTRLHT